MPGSDPPLPAGMVSAHEAFARVQPLLDGRLLLASDFDGTLSRLVMDPWQATIIPTARRALRRLAATSGTHVAIISGRTVPDLAARVHVGGISYHGDHGAEWATVPRGFRPGTLLVERESADPAAVALVRRLCVEVPRRVPEPWLVVEDKGPAVTFHFRGAPDVDAARARVRSAVDAIDREGLLAQPGGRRAWELRPRGATTKGAALVRLMAEHAPDTVLMLGDDRHDADAFDALREARRAGRVRGLAVAVLSPAGDPSEMARRADIVFADADVNARFLGLVARARARAHDPRGVD